MNAPELVQQFLKFDPKVAKARECFRYPNNSVMLRLPSRACAIK
jgi:hypothetical protein